MRACGCARRQMRVQRRVHTHSYQNSISTTQRMWGLPASSRNARGALDTSPQPASAKGAGSADPPSSRPHLPRAPSRCSPRGMRVRSVSPPRRQKSAQGMRSYRRQSGARWASRSASLRPASSVGSSGSSGSSLAAPCCSAARPHSHAPLWAHAALRACAGGEGARCPASSARRRGHGPQLQQRCPSGACAARRQCRGTRYGPAADEPEACRRLRVPAACPAIHGVALDARGRRQA